jgi:hypothetical protein
MKLFIKKLHEKFYYIETRDPETYTCKEIAEELDIYFKKYETIMKNCNAKINDMGYSFSFYFENKKDAQKVIKLLEPYLVIAKLMS